MLLVSGLWVALLVTYSFVYTTWTGYDEAQHVDMVYGLQHGVGWPGPGEKIMTLGVTATSDDFDRGRYADMFLHGQRRNGAEPFAEIDPPGRADRQSFDALGGATPIDDGRLSNQMIQHPPMVYALGAGLLTVLPGSEDWAYDQQVYALRALNVAIMAPLPLLCWAAGRRFGLDERLAQAAAVLPLAIPGLTRVGGTFNNDGVLIVTTGALTVVLAGVLRGDRRLRTGAFAGLWLGLAMNSKGLALALPVVVLAAYAAVWFAERPHHSLPWRPALLATGLGTALGIGFYVRNVVLYGSVQPNAWATNPPRREALLLPDSFFTWLPYFFRVMIDRFWSGLGLFEPPSLTPVAVVTATVVLGACLIAAFARRPRLPTDDGGTACGAFGPAVLVLPVVLTYLMVGQRSWAEYQHYTRGIAVQGRYLYLGMVGLAVVAVVGGQRLLRGRVRYLVPATLGAALVMQALAMLAVCSYYWLPRGTSFTPLRIPEIVDGIARWAPFPIGVTVAAFVVTALLAAAALAVTVAESATPARSATPSDRQPLDGTPPVVSDPSDETSADMADLADLAAGVDVDATQHLAPS